MYCKKCGKEIDNDSIFCSSCGTAVSNTKTEKISTPVTNNVTDTNKAKKIEAKKPSVKKPVAYRIIGSQLESSNGKTKEIKKSNKALIIICILSGIFFISFVLFVVLPELLDINLFKYKKSLEGKVFIKLNDDNKRKYELIFERNNQVLINEYFPENPNPIGAFLKVFETKYEYDKKTKKGNFTPHGEWMDGWTFVNSTDEQPFIFSISGDNLILESNRKLGGTYIDVNSFIKNKGKNVNLSEKKQDPQKSTETQQQTKIILIPQKYFNPKFVKDVKITKLDKNAIIFVLDDDLHDIELPNSFYYGDNTSTNNIGLCDWVMKQYKLNTYDLANITYSVSVSGNIINYQIDVQRGDKKEWYCRAYQKEN